MVKLRRGFIKESEEYATEFRNELGLAASVPICPHAIANHLEIPVLKISDHPTITQNVKLHMAKESQQHSSSFSAVTLADGTFREILYNDYQHPNRQTSSIMHEIAHIVLGHPPRPPFIGEACRTFDPLLEKEANELGFTILIPKLAALFAVEAFPHRRRDAATHFGVSIDLLEYRIRKSNAIGWSQNRQRRSAA